MNETLQKIQNKSEAFKEANDFFERLLKNEFFFQEEGGIYRNDEIEFMACVAPVSRYLYAVSLGMIAKDSREFPPVRTQIRLNALSFADFFDWEDREGLEIETNRHMRATGLAGLLWGAIIVIDPRMSPEQVLILAEDPSMPEGNPNYMISLGIQR